MNVFQLNSHAIALVQKGRYGEAINRLKAAMTWMRDLVHDPSRSGFELIPIEGYRNQFGNEVIHDISIISVPARHDEGQTTRDVITNRDTLFQFFDSAFVTVFLSYQGARGQRLSTSFVLYNLALCYHHREIHTSGMKGMDPEKLRTALMLYRKALRIIDTATDDGRFEDMTVLLLAIMNNMGHLHAIFGDTDMTRHCINWIQNLLAQPHVWHLGQNRADIAFFYQNPLFNVHSGSTFDKAGAA